MAMMNADDTDRFTVVVVNVDRDLWNVVSTDITCVYGTWYTVPSMLLSMTSSTLPARKIATSLSLFTHRLSCRPLATSQSFVRHGNGNWVVDMG